MKALVVSKVRDGSAGWVLLVLGVVVWDVCAPATLSDAFRRARQSPVSAVIVGASWAFLTLHLWGVLPSQADPLCHLKRRDGGGSR